MSNEEIQRIDKESIKLIKGQRGSYGYELKVLDEQINEDTLKRLKQINDRLKEEYKDGTS